MKYKLYTDGLARDAEDLTAWLHDLAQKNPGMYGSTPGPAMAMIAMCQMAWMRSMEACQRRSAIALEKLADAAKEANER